MSSAKKLSKSAKASSTRWYMKLENNFFGPRIKSLRRYCGDGGIVIFLQIALASVRDNGFINRHNAELGESFAEELGYLVDRDPEEVEKVVHYCIKLELFVPTVADQQFYIPYADNNGEYYTAEAARQQRHRDRKKAAEALRNNGEALRNNGEALQSHYSNSTESKQDSENIHSYSKSYECDSDESCLFDESDVEKFGFADDVPGDGDAPDGGPVRESSLDELTELSEQGGVGLSPEGAQAYHKATHGGVTYLGKSIDVPLRAMRAWAKKNREKHPEYFSDDGASESSGKAEPAALPIWDPESENFIDSSDDDFVSVSAKVSGIRASDFDARAEEGADKARDKFPGHDDRWYSEWGERYAARHFLLNREKRSPGYLSAGEISCLLEYYNGWDDPSFYAYVCENRANG